MRIRGQGKKKAEETEEAEGEKSILTPHTPHPIAPHPSFQATDLVAGEKLVRTRRSSTEC